MISVSYYNKDGFITNNELYNVANNKKILLNVNEYQYNGRLLDMILAKDGNGTTLSTTKATYIGKQD